jgi:YegS/Rv2252/BmrU family lipid kinase
LSVAIIINPVSGGAPPEAARRRAELAIACVERHGDRGEAFVTERPGHARDLARAAARRGVRLVLAWGGDGTINEVASALTFDETPIGIIPAGSGNGLATELGISRRPEIAIAEALAAEPEPIDVGEIEGRLFVNVAGIGIDACVAAGFNQAGNRKRGLLGYARITARALATYVPASYTIVSDRGRLEVRAVLISLANSPQFGNNARIAPGARVDDGLLDVVVVAERSRWRTIAALPRLFDGTIDRVPGCSIFRTRQATVESPGPMTFHVDGEPVEGGTRLKVRVHPGALRVCVKSGGRPRLP